MVELVQIGPIRKLDSCVRDAEHRYVLFGPRGGRVVAGIEHVALSRPVANQYIQVGLAVHGDDVVGRQDHESDSAPRSKRSPCPLTTSPDPQIRTVEDRARVSPGIMRSRAGGSQPGVGQSTASRGSCFPPTGLGVIAG